MYFRIAFWSSLSVHFWISFQVSFLVAFVVTFWGFLLDSLFDVLLDFLSYSPFIFPSMFPFYVPVLSFLHASFFVFPFDSFLNSLAGVLMDSQRFPIGFSKRLSFVDSLLGFLLELLCGSLL